MIIILEGPEAAGKSTLAKKLSEQSGFEIVSKSWPRGKAEQEAMLDMYREAAYGSANVIFDRCWYSEMVYGPIMRDKSYITYEHMNELEDILVRNSGAMLIHCTDNMRDLWKRFVERGDDYIKPDMGLLMKIAIQYDHLMHCVPHKIPVMRYELSKNLS